MSITIDDLPVFGDQLTSTEVARVRPVGGEKELALIKALPPHSFGDGHEVYIRNGEVLAYCLTAERAGLIARSLNEAYKSGEQPKYKRTTSNQIYMETIARAFRYRLRLTDAQEEAVARQEEQLRRCWNRLVNSVRRTLRDWEHGRQTQVLAECLKLLSAKKCVGKAASKARTRAEQDGVAVSVALLRNRNEKIKKLATYGPRRLGVVIAQERLTSMKQTFYGGEACLLYGLLPKFKDSCENWLKRVGTAQAPQFKRANSRVALQRQITATTPYTIGWISDLSALIGQSGKHCHTVWHRPLPRSAVVKQIAIAGKRGARYLIVFFNADLKDLAKPFGNTGQALGIDTGYCCALTAVGTDGDIKNPQQYQPPLARDKSFLKRLRRMQRKMDRQKRSANPECFNADGTWKKGKRARHLTKALVETHRAIQKMHEHVADTRRDFYHKTAFSMLSRYDEVALGDWRPKAERKPTKPAKPGEAKARRNRNRKGLDHAISSFASILKDKANLAAVPKVVEDINEPWTTQDCAQCGKTTGPKGPTNIFEWTCSACGHVHQRKANAAVNILQKFVDAKAQTA